MLEISNSMRQRLANRPEPQTHPDANLLAAYAERALPAAEREQVISHLAACAACREIVSLALPEPVAATVQPPLAGGRRSWMPMFRWAAVAATLAVAVAVWVDNRPGRIGVVTPQVSKGPSNVEPDSARREARPAATPGTEAEDRLTAMAPAPAASQPAPPKAAAGNSVIIASNTANNTKTGEAGIAGLRDQARAYSRKDAARPALAFRPGSAGAEVGTVSVNGAAPSDDRAAPTSALAYEYEAGIAPPLISAPEPKVAPDSEIAKKEFLNRRLPPISLDDVHSRALGLSGSLPTGDTAFSPPESAAGGNNLKSNRFAMRAGKVAAAVKKELGHLEGTPAPASAFAPSSVHRFGATQATDTTAPEALSWRISPDGKLMKSQDLKQWHEAYPQNGSLLFKVVVTDGSNVWVGGNNMTLIHSWNGGVNWNRFQLADTTAADITGITIDDGQVKVKTSDNQTWVSQDGGKTWVPLKPGDQPK